MKFLKPLLKMARAASRNSLGGGSSSRVQKQPSSFGEKRAQQMNSRLTKAIKERNSLLRKEFASPDPLNQAYQQKGRRLDAEIRKLKDQTQ